MSAKAKPTNGKRHVDWSLIAEDDREYLNVHVTIWDAEARVRTLNAKELMDFIQIGGDNIGFKLVALCLIDHDGNQLFKGPDETEITITNPDSMAAALARVMQKNPKAINQIAEALISLNSITLKKPGEETTADEIKNDSGETPTDVSPTA